GSWQFGHSRPSSTFFSSASGTVQCGDEEPVGPVTVGQRDVRGGQQELWVSGQERVDLVLVLGGGDGAGGVHEPLGGDGRRGVEDARLELDWRVRRRVP